MKKPEPKKEEVLPISESIDMNMRSESTMDDGREEDNRTYTEDMISYD